MLRREIVDRCGRRVKVVVQMLAGRFDVILEMFESFCEIVGDSRAATEVFPPSIRARSSGRGGRN